MPSEKSIDDRLREIHDAHADAVYRYLVRLTLGERHASQDYLQETMLRAWQHMDSLPEDVEGARPWLFTVARHVAIDAGRARKVRPVEVGNLELSWIGGTEDFSGGAAERRSVADALRVLTVAHREVLIELYYRNATVEEASRRLRIPEGTVKSRKHYALLELRRILSDPAD